MHERIMQTENAKNIGRIEASLEQLRRQRSALPADASTQQKRFLDEMIAIGEERLRALRGASWSGVSPSPWSLLLQRVGKNLLLFLGVALFMFFVYFVLGAFQRLS